MAFKPLWSVQHLVWMHLLASGGTGIRMNGTAGYILNPTRAGVAWACRHLYIKWKDTLDQTLERHLEQPEILISLLHPNRTRPPPLLCWWHSLASQTSTDLRGHGRAHMLSCSIPYLPAEAAVIWGARDFQSHQGAGDISKTLPRQASQTFPKSWPSSMLHTSQLPLGSKNKDFHWSQ